MRQRTSNNRLSVNFEKADLNASSYEGFNAEDLYTALPERYRESGRPLFVYLTSDLPEHVEATQALQQDVFFNEKIAIGMKMFSPIKVDGLKVGKDHPYGKILAGSELPRLIVVGTDGKKIGSLEGRAGDSKVFALIKKASDKTYKTSIDTFVKDYTDFLDLMDRVDGRRDDVAKDRKAVEKLTPAIEKKWAKEDDEIAKLEKEAIDFESKLLEFRRKGEKASTSVAKSDPK